MLPRANVNASAGTLPTVLPACAERNNAWQDAPDMVRVTHRTAIVRATMVGRVMVVRYQSHWFLTTVDPPNQQRKNFKNYIK
jgi:hypothetical protein